jgi:hypothetical protein
MPERCLTIKSTLKRVVDDIDKIQKRYLYQKVMAERVSAIFNLTH